MPGKSRRKAAQKGPPPPDGKTRKHGLYNQGSTCYLNSVLQVLFMTQEFRKALERSSAPDTMDQHLLTLFKDLEKRTASTTEIIKTLQIKVNQQRDAAEYLEQILMRTSAKSSKIFEGELTAKCRCLTCENESRTTQPFWSLPIPLVVSGINDCKVVDGIEEYFKESLITGEDQLDCNNCKYKTNSAFKLAMTHHPEVLTLLLKRFHFDNSNRMYIKNQQSVEVPFRLTVENQKYELYAFVEHFGGLKGGHYTVNIKSQDDEMWHLFDDSVVTRLDYQPFQVDCSQRSESAYLLFYKAYKNDDNLTQNFEGSPAGDPPKTSRNTVEKDMDSEDRHESDDNERNKRKRHCFSQLDNDKQGITSVKDENIVGNLDKPRDDATCVTDVEMENLNRKTVDDRKEAGKNQRPSYGNDRAKITQTSSTGSQKKTKINNKAQGNQQQEKDEEPGTCVGDKGLKVQTVKELNSRDEKNDKKSGQCLNLDDQEKRDYQHNREEEDLSKANKSLSGEHGASQCPPERKKKNSFRDERDEGPTPTRTKPEGLLNEKGEAQCTFQRELQDVPKGEVEEMVEERQIKVDENTGKNRDESIVELVSRSKAVNTKMDKPAQVFYKAVSMDKTDLDTTIDNRKDNPTQQASLREKQMTKVEEALLRAKTRDTKRTGTVEQIKPSVSDETDLSISSNTASVPFRKAETQEILDPEETRHPNSPKGLTKSYHHDLSSQKSSTESMNPSTTETQQFGVIESSGVECVFWKRQIGEDRKAGENGESSFAQHLCESKGQTEPAEEGKPQQIQSNSENLKDWPLTGLPEQTVGNQPEVKSSTEADIKSGPGSVVEKKTAGQKPKKDKKYKKLFSISAPTPRR
uniref:Ubiquitin carboxyl-terminal hydrolase n=1 Tax=Gouania willdenowi TaxID=441366 RepID=A0A8C5EUA7_GOUWI